MDNDTSSWTAYVTLNPVMAAEMAYYEGDGKAEIQCGDGCFNGVLCSRDKS